MYDFELSALGETFSRRSRAERPELLGGDQRRGRWRLPARRRGPARSTQEANQLYFILKINAYSPNQEKPLQLVFVFLGLGFSATHDAEPSTSTGPNRAAHNPPTPPSSSDVGLANRGRSSNTSDNPSTPVKLPRSTPRHPTTRLATTSSNCTTAGGRLGLNAGGRLGPTSLVASGLSFSTPATTPSSCTGRRASASCCRSFCLWLFLFGS